MDTKYKFMETGKALEIVHSMAAHLYQHGMESSTADHKTALDTVEDFLVNNFADKEGSAEEEEDTSDAGEEATYCIVRFFKDPDKDREIIETGLTRKEAQEHCSSPHTKAPDGSWFDGFEQE